MVLYDRRIYVYIDVKTFVSVPILYFILKPNIPLPVSVTLSSYIYYSGSTLYTLSPSVEVSDPPLYCVPEPPATSTLISFPSTFTLYVFRVICKKVSESIC